VASVRLLLPEPLPEPVDGPARYQADQRGGFAHRPWVLLNMVASLDGAIAIEGRSGGLGGDSDRAVFLALRTCADVIVVGAGTARAEDYGPPQISADDRARRVERGQAPVPRLAVVTASLRLDPTSRLFADPERRPIVVTTSDAPVDQRRVLAEVADIVEAGLGRVDVRAMLGALRAGGAEVALCEGGPTLNGQLAAEGMVDEVCLTISPLLVGGHSPRLADSSEAGLVAAMRLDRLLEDDGSLFLRYVRDRPDPTDRPPRSWSG
jgi:riboflavin-specific deaminase-like protein